ncbi:MAG: hypothetical protein HRU09_12080 [Oligoflexales bacterium]|nr:hypothetical protein [Oligoflexales bacterium]
MKLVLFSVSLLFATASLGSSVSLFKDTITTSLNCEQDDGSLTCSYYEVISAAQEHAKAKSGEYLGYDIISEDLRDGKNSIQVKVKYLK